MIATTLIEVPSWGTVTLIEAIWLFAGLMAMLFSASHLPALWLDRGAAMDTEKPALIAVAWGYLRREIIRLLQGVCLTFVGAYAAIEPPAIPGPARISIVGIVLTAVLLALSLLVSAQSWFDWRTRHRVQLLLKNGNGNGG